MAKRKVKKKAAKAPDRMQARFTLRLSKKELAQIKSDTKKKGFGNDRSSYVRSKLF